LSSLEWIGNLAQLLLILGVHHGLSQALLLAAGTEERLNAL
jgi:hypothetical protein